MRAIVKRQFREVTGTGQTMLFRPGATLVLSDERYAVLHKAGIVGPFSHLDATHVAAQPATSCEEESQPAPPPAKKVSKKVQQVHPKAETTESYADLEYLEKR